MHITSPAHLRYVLEKNNKFLGPTTSARSFLQDAKQLLENGGPLGEVALLLEAAIQRNEPGEGGYEAWLLLGETRSMDEREEAALRAFTEGVRIAQEHGGGGAGMIVRTFSLVSLKLELTKIIYQSLAIAFTNEGYERASYSTLLRWLRAQYPSHTIPPDTLQSTTKSAWHSQPLVTDAFLALARNQHEAGEMDADVQIALGVLFYGRGEYEHARDCFQSALAARPDVCFLITSGVVTC
jgi:peroxin-5